jgi:hypothetical protein
MNYLFQIWYRNFSEGNITIKEELYTLILTANKRIPIYENNKRKLVD